MPTFELSLSDGRVFHVDATDPESAHRDLLAHIQPQQSGGVLDAVRQGASNLLGGIGDTNKVLTGGGDQTLKGAAAAVAPQNQADTTLYDDKGLHPENLANAAAEGAPATAAALAAARLTPGPIWAKLLAAGGVGAYQMFGPMAKQAAEKRTGDANATPNNDDMLSAAKRAVPEAAIQALPVGGLAARAAAKLGIGGIAGSVARSVGDTAAMGGASAGANVYDQAVQGNDINPTEAINAGLSGAANMAPFAAGHTVGDVKAAVKFRGISDLDPNHITEAANRVTNAADSLDLNLRNTKDGGTAIAAAQSDVGTEFKSALDAIKNSNKPAPGSGQTQAPLPQDVQNALARAQKGLPLGDEDVATLKSFSGNSGAVDDLVRLGGVSNALKGATDTGYLDSNGNLKGGLSARMERGIRSVANPVGAAAGLGIAHFGGFGLPPEAAAGLAGTYALARLNDAVTGNRSPALAFARRFADGNAIPQGTPARPSAPPGPAGPGPGVGGGAVPATGGPGLAALNAMAQRGLPWGPRNAPPTGPQVPMANGPQGLPWGPRNAPLTGPGVPLAPPPVAPAFDPASLAPGVKDILKSGPTAYLNRVQGNSQAPELQLDLKGITKRLASVMAARNYADTMRAKQQQQTAPQAPAAAEPPTPAPDPMPQPAPPVDLSAFKGPVRAALNARMKMLAMQNKATAEPNDVIPSFLPNRGAPPPAPVAAPAAASPPAAENAPAIPAQSAENVQALVPKVTKLTKANGKVVPTVEAKAPTPPTAPPPEPKIELAKPKLAVDIPKPSTTEETGIPDFLRRAPGNTLPGTPPTADVATKALAKMLADRAPQTSPMPPVSKAATALAKLHNAEVKKPTTVALSPHELSMSSEEYGDHYTRTSKPQLTPGSDLFNKISQAAAATDARKMALADKLAEITGQKSPTIKNKLRGTKYRVQAEQMRDFLTRQHPDDANAIKSAMSDEVLRALWVRHKPKA